jgi:hypothetical protein
MSASPLFVSRIAPLYLVATGLDPVVHAEAELIKPTRQS